MSEIRKFGLREQAENIGGERERYKARIGEGFTLIGEFDVRYISATGTTVNIFLSSRVATEESPMPKSVPELFSLQNNRGYFVDYEGKPTGVVIAPMRKMGRNSVVFNVWQGVEMPPQDPSRQTE